MPARAVLKWTFKSEADREDFRGLWRKGSQIIQNESVGARSTKLHIARGEPLAVYAIAEWDSLEARDSAMAILTTKYAADHPVHSDGAGVFERVAELEEIDVVYKMMTGR